MRNILTKVVTNLDLGVGPYNHPAINCTGLDKVSIQATLVYEAGEDSVGTFKLQASNDLVNWNDITGSSQAFSSTAVSSIWEVDVYSQALRVVTTITSGTSATLTIIAVSKLEGN